MPDPRLQRCLDKGLFGHFVRTARTEAGYEKAEDFAKAISDKTGYAVSKQTIYSIESGKQEPKISLYLAMMSSPRHAWMHPFAGCPGMYTQAARDCASNAS
ncbi:MAG: hypothetical protein IJ131_08240 [Eggerthellaceae bacterium]|nr:hypothetical protein [Eggerthellaceae bacterium]